MKMQILILVSLLIAFAPQPSLGGEVDNYRASQLMSAPEMMECSLERSRALWQFPNPARLGEVPCQFLNSVGGPEVGKAIIYTPTQLEHTEQSLELSLTKHANPPITQPLDSFAPLHTRRGQWIDFTNTSLSRDSWQWFRNHL